MKRHDTVFFLVAFLAGASPSWPSLPAAAAGADDARAGYRAGLAGDYGGAVELLTRAIESGELADAELAAAHVNRGVALRRQDRLAEAIADFTAAAHLQPRNGVALRNRGLALAKWGRYDDAISDLSRVIAIDGNDAKAFLIRGNAYFDKRMFAEAIADYSRALEIAPRLEDADVNRRHARERLQHPDRACACTADPDPGAQQ